MVKESQEIYAYTVERPEGKESVYFSTRGKTPKGTRKRIREKLFSMENLNINLFKNHEGRPLGEVHFSPSTDGFIEVELYDWVWRENSNLVDSRAD